LIFTLRLLPIASSSVSAMQKPPVTRTTLSLPFSRGLSESPSSTKPVMPG